MTNRIPEIPEGTFARDLLAAYDDLANLKDPTVLAYEYLTNHLEEVCPSCGLLEPCNKDKTQCPATLLMAEALNLRIKEVKTLEPWFGVELDGGLATEVEVTENFELIIGDPVPDVVEVVKKNLEAGIKVKVFSPRVASTNPKRVLAARTIRKWTKEHIGVALDSTAEKDYLCLSLFAVSIRQLVPDQGLLVDKMLTQSYDDLKKHRAELAKYTLETPRV